VTEYYKAEDLHKFESVGKHNPGLLNKLIDWYPVALKPGNLQNAKRS
jgi:hypothetical protein